MAKKKFVEISFKVKPLIYEIKELKKIPRELFGNQNGKTKTKQTKK